MKKSLILQNWITVLAVFILLAFAQSAYADEDPLYWVEDEPLNWVLEGFPDSSRPIDYVEFRLCRDPDTEGTEHLLYS
ncbi:MAG TPA: hypothetical protein VJZ70_07265, partial [Limnochordia bacterium]|nr:hypothetical protein [Limnochordia bacterium]